MQSTVNSQERKPKVLFENTKDSTWEFTAQNRAPKVLFDVPPVKKGEPLFESSIFRKRLPVTLQDISNCNKNVIDSLVLNKALEIVLTTNVDDGDDMKIIYWGADLQTQHNQLLEFEFATTQSPLITTSQEELGKIVVILQEMDITKINPSMWSSIFTSVEISKQKIRKTLDEKYIILQSYIKSLQGKVAGLIDIVKKLQSHVVNLNVLIENVNASLLAGKFLSDYIGSDKHPDKNSLAKLKTQRVALDTRLIGLTATLGTLKVNIQQNDLSISLLNSLIENVQATLLVDIPLWYTSYIGFLTLNVSKTNDYNEQKQKLITQQQQILTKLKNYEHNV